MALTPRLDLRQSQSLVMTPQLQQAIKLLQLSNQELADYVETELEQNPLLQRDGGEVSQVTAYGEAPTTDPDRAAEGLGVDGVAPDAPTPGADDTVDMVAAERLPATDDSPLDMDVSQDWSSDAGAGDGPLPGAEAADWEPVGPTQFDTARGSGRGDFEDDLGGIEGRVSEPATLRAHLTAQLNMDVDDPSDRLIGAMLIDLIDDSGYLTAPLEPVAEALECARERVEAVLARMQRFEPIGVFARGLAECLALQLEDRDRLDPAMQAMLDNLELLAKRDIAALRRACGVDEEDLTDMVAEIRSLNPRPAAGFEADVIQTVVPDILMRAAPDGGWAVELNSETLPRVLVDHQYFALVHGQARRKQDKQYISEQFQSANWLIKSLHQRANTIIKVASEIVRQQDGFFRRGIQHLKPLILRDIAEAIDMHESTVSRVTTNKYMATPRGLFELKYFFTASIGATGNGAAHSAESVRHRIKSLIDAEEAAAVLSDDQIVDALRGQGIDIARRTVAKYRESMRIPSSVQRRREKALSL